MNDGSLTSEEATVSITVNAVADAPSLPSGLTATAKNKDISLNWNASLTVGVKHNVHRATTQGGPYTQIKANTNKTDYNDNSVDDGVTYYYVVRATLAGEGESANSNEASANLGG